MDQNIFLFIQFWPHIITTIDAVDGIRAAFDSKGWRLDHSVHQALLKILIWIS